MPQACWPRAAGRAARAGRDPKPWPPPFKLNREMVDAMGGADSEPYRRFRAYACEAYNILRKRAPRTLPAPPLQAACAGPAAVPVRARPARIARAASDPARHVAAAVGAPAALASRRCCCAPCAGRRR
jgi:hypothetical protein